MTATIPAAEPVAVVVDIPADLAWRNDDAVDGRLLVTSGHTDAGMPEGCPRCHARLHMLLGPGRWLLWCSHQRGWQVKRAASGTEAVA